MAAPSPSRWATFPTTLYLVEAFDETKDEAFIHQLVAKGADITAVAEDLLKGQYKAERFPITRIIEVCLAEGTSEDATETVLTEVVRLSELTGYPLGGSLIAMLDFYGVRYSRRLEAA